MVVRGWGRERRGVVIHWVQSVSSARLINFGVLLYNIVPVVSHVILTSDLVKRVDRMLGVLTTETNKQKN